MEGVLFDQSGVSSALKSGRVELLDSRYRSMNLPNAMSVDVEEYFQVSAFDDVVSRDEWRSMDSRLGMAIDKILGIFSAHRVKATFFTLGWIVDRHPEVVKRIANEGHEIASHGQEHTRVGNLGRERFRQDVEMTRKKLEDVTGTAVKGYRAPSFSVGRDTPWAHDELSEAGYRYSSSIFPIRHDHYGQPDSPRFPYRQVRSGIIEIPMSTVKVLGRHLPCSGGGYFRLLPLSYSLWAIRRINEAEGMPAIFYFHPWEIDPDQPRRSDLPLKSRFRHYVNLRLFEKRLTRLVDSFKWNRIDRVYLSN